jgi:hypothetical protein
VAQQFSQRRLQIHKHASGAIAGRSRIDSHF